MLFIPLHVVCMYNLAASFTIGICVVQDRKHFVLGEDYPRN